MKILVTGGNGMVGRHLQELLPNANYINSCGYDLTKEKSVIQVLLDINPDIVIHLAAKVGGILDNINKPEEYFTENILMNTLLLKYSQTLGVKRFIGILSTCIYPDVVENYPMRETDLHSGPPTKTNFSYGYSKRCMAVQIDACNQQHGTKYNYLIPCNLYGEYDKYGDNSHFVAALIKKIIKAKQSGDDHIVLFGSGKPLRQFMYAEDLAKVIVHCIENDVTESFNVATEENHSIDTIARIALKACDAEHIKILYDSEKPDGQFRKDVSVKKLKSIIPDFNPTRLEDGIKNTYEYLINNESILNFS